MLRFLTNALSEEQTKYFLLDVNARFGTILGVNYFPHSLTVLLSSGVYRHTGQKK